MIDLLPEDADERRMFNDSCKVFGGPLEVIAIALTSWGAMSPKEGSFAKQCYVMANEIRKVDEKLKRKKK